MPCVREDKIVLQRPTAMAICENGHYFAIGFDSGSISLYRGDISRDRSKNLKYLSFGSSPITGIAFKQYAKVVYMFVCSDAGVNVYNLQVKDREIKTVLDRAVDTRRCSALQSAYDSNETHFMVGMDDVSAFFYVIEPIQSHRPRGEFLQQKIEFNSCNGLKIAQNSKNSNISA